MSCYPFSPDANNASFEFSLFLDYLYNTIEDKINVCCQGDEQADNGGAGETHVRSHRETGAGVRGILHRYPDA